MEVESQFAAARVTSELTRCYYLVVILPREALLMLFDILFYILPSPPTKPLMTPLRLPFSSFRNPNLPT